MAEGPKLKPEIARLAGHVAMFAWQFNSMMTDLARGILIGEARVMAYLEDMAAKGGVQ